MVQISDASQFFKLKNTKTTLFYNIECVKYEHLPDFSLRFVIVSI